MDVDFWQPSGSHREVRSVNRAWLVLFLPSQAPSEIVKRGPILVFSSYKGTRLEERISRSIIETTPSANPQKYFFIVCFMSLFFDFESIPATVLLDLG